MVDHFASWRRDAASGVWLRKLIGPEKMFDEWLELDGWVEHITSVTFSVQPGTETRAFKSPRAWFTQAVTKLFMDTPSLLTSIKRGGGLSAPLDTEREFAYRPLKSIDDLNRRVEERISVLASDDIVELGLKTITDQFYGHPEKRISLELGESLVHLTLISSSSQPAKYALALRSHHALLDFLGAMNVLNRLLGNLTMDASQIDPPHCDGTDITRLHPSYLDLIDSTKTCHPSISTLEKSAELIRSHLSTKVYAPNHQSPASADPDTEYSVRRHLLSERVSQNFIAAGKAQGITVTALLTTLQTLALLETFPCQAAQSRTVAPNCVMNRLLRVSLAKHTDQQCREKQWSSLSGPHITQPVMATNFLISPFDIGYYLDLKSMAASSLGSRPAWKEALWTLAANVQKALEQASASNIPEYPFWTDSASDVGFGAVSRAIAAIKSGNALAPPGVLTPLSNPGLLDGVCLQKSYESQNGDPMLQLEDVEFFPRVSSLFGGQTWAWTALGKLNVILVLPDPRICSSDQTGRWWTLFRQMIEETASE